MAVKFTGTKFIIALLYRIKIGGHIVPAILKINAIPY